MTEASNRLGKNKSPSLACNDEDKFTVSNGKLKYPVGLITADELAYAGGVYYIANTTYYLYTDNTYWTMSPIDFNHNEFITYNYVRIGVVAEKGDIELYGGGQNFGLRPVLALTSSTKVTGTGTSENPYIVV